VATKTLSTVATKTLNTVATKTLSTVATKTLSTVATKTLSTVATKTLSTWLLRPLARWGEGSSLVGISGDEPVGSGGSGLVEAEDHRVGQRFGAFQRAQ
jgi:hypothetical protein